jgi:hypothetical protein
MYFWTYSAQVAYRGCQMVLLVQCVGGSRRGCPSIERSHRGDSKGNHLDQDQGQDWADF